MVAARPPQLSPGVRRGLEGFPEIDCIRHRLAPGVAAAAERRALALGVGADQVLITAGGISEERYFRSLAFSLALPFVELDLVPAHVCPLNGEQLLPAATGCLLPLVVGGQLVWVVAPSGRNLRRVIPFLRAHPELRRRILISSPAQVRRFVCRHTDRALAERAADWLRFNYPICSAAICVQGRRRISVVMLTAGLGILTFMVTPVTCTVLLQIAISGVFLAWTGLRLVGASQRPLHFPKSPRADDTSLPIYTIIVALHREATAVTGLIEALRGLDYPPEKLDIKLVLEADDPETLPAIERMGLCAPFEVMFAPVGAPRTKPKALNAALQFARGEFTVVFDAEDRPQPGQLREALAAFRADPIGEVACLQARLAIDNPSDGWLAALFAAEYAGLFDVLLPGLAALGMPLPLGGSSNHFRTAVLREVGAWDPYNVTEDADLGTRLARLGYRTDVIASTTYEEATARVDPWIKQRTRWMKGWMQTWLVHMRRPLRLVQDLGVAGFATFQLMLIGTVLAALLQPFAILLIVAAAMWGEILPSLPYGSWGHAALNWLNWIALLAGYGVSILLAFMGLARRRLWWIAWRLLLMPGHWALLSFAAWRAVFQLWSDPFRWEKTEHRLGRRPAPRAISPGQR